MIDSMGGKAISIPLLCDECEKRMADVVENHEDDRLVQAVVVPGCNSLWGRDKVEDCDGVLEEDSRFGEQSDSGSECGSLHEDIIEALDAGRVALDGSSSEESDGDESTDVEQRES